MKNPPMTGPMTVVTPNMAMKRPMYRPRPAGRHHVPDDGLGADHEAAAAEPLDGAEGDQLDHRVG